jgi:hypothetical protein
MMGLAATALSLGNPSRLHADLITLSSSIPSPSAVIDFSQFAGPNMQAAGPIEVGGLSGESVSWSSSSSYSVIGDDDYGLALNGSWDSRRSGFVGSNDTEALLRFDFNSGPVAAAGGFVNYAPGYGDFVMRVLGVDNTVLESYNIASSTPVSTYLAINDGAFRGIVRPTNDIAALELYGAYHVLDDLRFHRAQALPLPATLPVFAVGVLCLILVRMRT